MESGMGVTSTVCHAAELLLSHQSNGIACIKIEIVLSWAFRSKNRNNYRIRTNGAAAVLGANLCKKNHEGQNVTEFQNKHLW